MLVLPPVSGVTIIKEQWISPLTLAQAPLPVAAERLSSTWETDVGRTEKLVPQSCGTSFLLL
jgi:hypothetical protein